jgi:hypothetical protein
MSLCCQKDERRDAVRRMKGWNGLDYVEVDDTQRTLYVYFLGKLPPELRENETGLKKYLRIEGGARVTGIQIIEVDPVNDPDPEVDDFLVIQLDKYGDFSTYTLRIVGVKDVDPRYDHVDFSFKINCPSELDCAPVCACEPALPAEPEINYLAKDYASFRQLILDRLALLIPGWIERHVPDLGIALVEVLAYVGDYLSYYQDAVATEAYLDTARRRISVRRHARLVDYRLHEGCNARAWVHIEVSNELTLDDPTDVSFITGLNNALSAQQNVLNWDVLREVSRDAYEVFEPLQRDQTAPLHFRPAHNEIHFYTWGEKECCLERGSTSATLRDEWIAGDEAGHGKKKRALQLQPGDVLIFEEVLGARTGIAPDADPARRQAVRLKRISPGHDPITKSAEGAPAPYVEIEWAAEDALQFSFCISAIGAAPECKYIENISVARGNVLLVDHGKTLDPEDLGTVPTLQTEAACECANEPSDVQYIAGRFHPHLGKTPLTFSQPLPSDSPVQSPAITLLTQDVRSASPQIWLASQPTASWLTRDDLIESTASESHFVVEIDNDGIAWLRFGNGELGRQPPASMKVSATYRVGNGSPGNVGAEAISRLVLKNTKLNGVSVSVRNPLPAQGGADAEPMAEAKLFAPHQFRKQLERAIIAEDYECIAKRNPAAQNASAALIWTGSWYEADVAIDPFGKESADDALLGTITNYLENYRRIGHDLRVMPARYVPLYLKLEVCALPHYQRGHVKAALLALFSNRALPGGKRGFFHADNLTFGDGIYLSKIIAAAQTVPGVECAKVTQFHRLYESPNQEIENGLLPLRVDEIAQLDNDPNFPERGQLEIQVRGGR